MFLRADTPEELVQAQLVNNAINGKHYNYQTPVFDGDEWFVWFFADLRQWQNPEALDDEQINFFNEVYL